MKAYDLALMVFIFGAIVGVLNGMNLGSDIPNPGAPNSSQMEEKVEQINESTQSWGANPLGFFLAFQKGLSIFISAMTGVLAVSMILFSYGLPLKLCIAIQSIIYFVYVVGLVQFLSGRYIER